MATELHDYNNIIEDLKSAVNHADFDKQFKSKVSSVPKAKQFLIKMELKRLGQPCNRLLDLRGHVAGEPTAFEYKGQIHFLDEVAKQIFNDQIEKFGQYTIGCYEAVLNAENNHRIMHKKEQEARLVEKAKQEKTPRTTSVTEPEQEKQEPEKPKVVYGANLVHFTQYGIRAEERMNFSIAIEMQFSVGDTLKAVSSDLSVGGIKVKVPAARNIVKGQKIAIYLTGLEQEFELGLKDGIQYEVVGIDEINIASNYIRMKRTFTEDIAAFDDFLGNFINGNKRRYKVNLDNTLEAVAVKGYEQYYLPRVTTLPIYIRQINDRLLPTMALATENNRATLGYFSDESKNLVFQQILDMPRLEKMLLSERGIKESLLYCFTHARKGKIYFYSATTEELDASPELRSTFLHFASKKDSWKVYKLQLVPVSEHDAHIPLSVPDSAGKEIQRQNQAPPPKVQGLLQNLKFIVYMTPISNSDQKEAYQKYHEMTAPAVQLNKFGHPKLKRYINIEVETIEYVNLRSEERYLYKTGVSVALPGREERAKGTTRDFSSHGLQLVIEEGCPFSKGDLIVIGLPEMQRVTNKFNLTKLAYEIVAISRDKTVMNLRTFEPKGVHHGRQFFKKLILQNKAKLTPAKMESRYPGLSKALRNLCAKHVCNTPIYIDKEGTKVDINLVGKSCEANLILHLLSKHKPEQHDISLYPLLKDNSAANVFGPVVADMERVDTPKTVELFIRYRTDQNSEARSFICHYADQFLSNEMLTSFIKASTKTDVFFAFRIYISKTGRPDMDYISKELSYIGNYSQHRAKELEGRLWNVTGVGDMVDISEEVLIRFGYSVEQIQTQLERRYKLLN